MTPNTLQHTQIHLTSAELDSYILKARRLRSQTLARYVHRIAARIRQGVAMSARVPFRSAAEDDHVRVTESSLAQVIGDRPIG